MPVTHDVLNQPPPLGDHDVFSTDVVLVEGVRREGAAWAIDSLADLGRLAGKPEMRRLGTDANVFPPVLKTHDRYGNRVDEVEFHRSWHDLMTVAIARGLHANPWRDPKPGAHLARAAGFMVWSQVEGGHGCPVSMTYAAVPALRSTPALFDQWVPRFTSLEYDPGLRPAGEKKGALCGMAMTEKQGGSDVRANTTRAQPVGNNGEYRITGHKWFCSAPMCDAFLVLAQAPGGLSCFLMPRVLPDGALNGFHIQRLKDKLGNRSNASSEVEFDNATAFLVGEEGRGVRTIIEMVNHTRLDCVIGTTTLMRHGVVEASHHTSHRAAFGKTLIDQPLMRNVLADLAIESEAATTLMTRLAGAFDRAQAGDERETSFKRLATAVGKYWVCKRGPAHAAEALECFGGNGFVEDSGMPRLYREAPLNSIWEGSGNVNALDVLRAMAKEPEVVEVFLDEVDTAAGADARLDDATERLRKELADVDQIETRARRVVELAALVLQGSLLVRNAPVAVADAFCASRLGGDWGVAFGTLPAGTDFGTIIDRARVA
jgi:putative acyl-CoA dehydrogenase